MRDLIKILIFWDFEFWMGGNCRYGHFEILEFSSNFDFCESNFEILDFRRNLDFSEWIFLILGHFWI